MSGRKKIAPKMAAEQTRGQVNRTVEGKQPSGEEVPVAAKRKACARWQCRPGRKCTPRGLPVRTLGYAQNAGRFEIVAGDLRNADQLAVGGLDHRTDPHQRRDAAIAIMAPIEGRVRIENGESTHQEQDETQYVEPVGQPNRNRMSFDDYRGYEGKAFDVTCCNSWLGNA